MRTENEPRLGFLFDRALALRDADDLVAARVLLEQILDQLEAPDRLLRCHAHMQLGYFGQLRGEHEQRETHFRRAVEVLPHSELASIGWFLALFQLAAIARQWTRWCASCGCAIRGCTSR